MFGFQGGYFSIDSALFGSVSELGRLCVYFLFLVAWEGAKWPGVNWPLGRCGGV